MENQEQTAHLVPNMAFKQAFCKHFKCKPSDVEIKIIEENLSARVIYKKKVFEVRTYDSLLQETKDRLTDKDQAHYLDLSMFAEVFEYVKLNEDYYLGLLELLTTPEEYNTLQNAIIFHGKTSGSNEAFWNILYSIDRTGEVYAYSIIAAAQLVDLERCADELLDSQIVNGLTHYNCYEDGIFETVELKIKNMDEQTFYIYPTHLEF